MKTVSPKINLALARKVLAVVNKGLVKGLGNPVPGQMCVEAAVNYALGATHGDEPACVGAAVREFKIKLNDCNWPSDQARTDGMRALAIAQLGSDKLDQLAFGKLMFVRSAQKLMPFVFRYTAEKVKPERKDGYLKHAEACERVTTFEEAKKACRDASAYASACAYACASAYACAFASAYACACAYACAFADASAYAYACAFASAYACASACAFASAYADFKHELLKRTAQVGLDVLKEMKSPGCKWLYLVKD